MFSQLITIWKGYAYDLKPDCIIAVVKAPTPEKNSANCKGSSCGMSSFIQIRTTWHKQTATSTDIPQSPQRWENQSQVEAQRRESYIYIYTHTHTYVKG